MTGTSGQEHMSKLQITAMKSKNSTSNVYLVLRNHPQSPSLAVYVQQISFLMLKLSNLCGCQVKRAQFQHDLFTISKNMQYLQKKANQGAPSLLSLSGEDLYTEKQCFIKYLPYRLKRTNSYTRQFFLSMLDFLLSSVMHFYSVPKKSFTPIQECNIPMFFSKIKLLLNILLNNYFQ